MSAEQNVRDFESDKQGGQMQNPPTNSPIKDHHSSTELEIEVN